MAYISFQPSDYFNTQLYTGTGSTNAQTGIGFQPDWVWIQNRGGTYANVFFDAVRGATKLIEPQGTGAEATVSDTLTSFDSDGFTLGADSSNYCNRSSSPNTYVAWNWRANGQGSANSDGSITTTYTSANTTAGFSIVKWTGTGSAATVGHGLGVAPKWIIMKNLDDASGHFWVYHNSIGAGQRLLLNLTNASGANTNFVNNTAPTTSVFSVKNESNNTSGNDIIAYCFAEKKGFSKFGSYTGNASTDGTFVYLGFKPAMVIIKGNNTENWHIFDNKRDVGNPTDQALQPNNASQAEFTETNVLDFLSNGFKLGIAGSGFNGSGVEYIYMAWAEHPLVSSNGVPATAK